MRQDPTLDPARLLDLINSDFTTPQTRKALLARLAHFRVELPVFFSQAQFNTLTAVCQRLIPQESDGPQVDLPGLLDEYLKSGEGKGWRYDDLPPDAMAFPLGMDGMEETAMTMFGQSFQTLSDEQKDKLLIAIQTGQAPGEAWRRMPSPRFFEELMVILSELYYSHPLAKAQIGDLSFADAKGWESIGLDGRDAPMAFVKPNQTKQG